MLAIWGKNILRRNFKPVKGNGGPGLTHSQEIYVNNQTLSWNLKLKGWDGLENLSELCSQKHGNNAIHGKSRWQEKTKNTEERVAGGLLE
jgi:hypothetical protein